MHDSGQDTDWLGGLRMGDHKAAQHLWEKYFRRLVALARSRLGSQQRGLEDSEDIALNAFDSFCRGVEENRFPKLVDRDDLWQLLVMLTARKAVNAVRKKNAFKRGGKSALIAEPVLEEIIGREPTPAFALEVADRCRYLMEALPDLESRQIAQWKLEGFTHPEIAEKLGISLATVERRLSAIRAAWRKLDRATDAALPAVVVGYQLRIVTAPVRQGEIIPLPRTPMKFGRARESQVRLLCEGISRCHCEIVWNDELGQHELLDPESKNGTFVNHQRVKEKCPLKPGDDVRLPGMIMRFEVRSNGL